MTIIYILYFQTMHCIDDHLGYMLLYNLRLRWSTHWKLQYPQWPGSAGLRHRQQSTCKGWQWLEANRHSAKDYETKKFPQKVFKRSEPPVLGLGVFLGYLFFSSSFYIIFFFLWVGRRKEPPVLAGIFILSYFSLSLSLF